MADNSKSDRVLDPLDTAQVLDVLAADPTAGLLAAADLREQRAQEAASLGTDWHAAPDGYDEMCLWATRPGTVNELPWPVVRGGHLGRWQANVPHIAAEANPAHALAEAALWRGIAERHALTPSEANKPGPPCWNCGDTGERYIGTGPDGHVRSGEPCGCDRWHCAICGMLDEDEYVCPDLLAAVAAARTYLGGT